MVLDKALEFYIALPIYIVLFILHSIAYFFYIVLPI